MSDTEPTVYVYEESPERTAAEVVDDTGETVRYLSVSTRLFDRDREIRAAQDFWMHHEFIAP